MEKRLRLGNAAPVLLEAYRAGDIDLDTLMAFAVTTDQARQNAAWATVSQQGYRPGAWQIKRLLTEDRVSATSAIARFVGLEAYEAAGGKVDRDLVRRGGRAGDLARRSRSLEQARHGQPPGRGEGTGDALEMDRGAARRGLERHRRLRAGASATGRANGRGGCRDRTLEDPQRRARQHGRRRLDRRIGRGSRVQRDAARRDRGHDRGPRGLPAPRISLSPGASPPSATTANSN